MEDSPTSTMVQFNASIVPPFELEQEPTTPAEEETETEVKIEQPPPLPQPPMHVGVDSDFLCTLLVGIGVAYTIGVLTGYMVVQMGDLAE